MNSGSPVGLEPTPPGLDLHPDPEGVSQTRQLADFRPDAPVRGDRFLRWLDAGFIRLNAAVQAGLPSHLNPLAQMGAVANACFIAALASGIALLVWYKPSVHLAYDSLARMPWLGQWLRALHRYSSDGCMLFVVLHGIQSLAARRFTGARVLAWVTGVALMVALWLDGWLGYWLVWDERAQIVATETARWLDFLPVFAMPLRQSFLTNQGLHSLLFFVVFFAHMLLPLAMGVALWLHIVRLSRPRFLPNRPLAIAVIVSLALVSALVPAHSARPADMLWAPQPTTMDWFYLAPLAITQRLHAGVVWGALLMLLLMAATLPWWLTRQRPVQASVLVERCIGCGRCHNDCPYQAVTMVEGQGRKGRVAMIDPALCIGCGICVGACDPAGIDFPLLPAGDSRHRVDQWITEALQEDSHPHLAFLCANSAAADLRINPQTGRSPDLPGYRVMAVPCVGWIHPMLVERALRRGAAGVLIAGCSPDPPYRLGGSWTQQRLHGEREPLPRHPESLSGRVLYLQYYLPNRNAFLRRADEFRLGGDRVTSGHRQPPVARFAASVAVLACLLATTIGGSDARTPRPLDAHPALIVSFMHTGQPLDHAVSSSQAGALPHMQGADVGRRPRAAVRLQVYVDGDMKLNKSFPPRGLFHDGPSIGLERLPLSPGRHRIRLRLGDTADTRDWGFTDERTVLLESRQRCVVQFDKLSGFRWH